MSSFRKQYYIFAILLITCLQLFAIACSTPSPIQDIHPDSSTISESSVNQDTVLRIATTFLDEYPDPYKAGWLAVPSGLSETLFRLGDNLKPEPWLANHANQVEPNIWEITLRQDVTFHNGVGMNSDKVKGSLEKAIEQNAGTKSLLGIRDIAIKDSHTLLITTDAPNPAFLGLLANPNTGIADPNTISDSKDGSNSGPAMTGPYKVISFSADESMLVERFPDYWRGMPASPSIEFMAFPEANSRLIALQSGDVDIAVNLPPQAAETIDKDSSLDLLVAPPSSLLFMFVNHESLLMQDLQIRKAVTYAINRSAITNSVALGNALPAGSIYPPKFLSCTNPRDHTFNPILSKELLSQAGYEDKDEDGIVEKENKSLSLTLQTYPQQPLLPPMLEVVQSMLKDVGIDSNIEIVEWTLASQGGYDLFGYSNSTVNTGDPQWGLTQQFFTEGDENRGNYSNPSVDALINQLAGSIDPEKRKSIACDALWSGMDDVALVPVMHPNRLYGLSDRIDWASGPHPLQLYFVDYTIGFGR